MVRKAAKPKPGAELAQQMFAILEQRATTDDYPCALNDVAREANSDVSDEEILIATKAAPLKSRGIVAFVDEPDSLVALKEDKERLAGDDRILRELLSRLCSPQLPHVPVDSLKLELVSPLRAPFAKEMKQRIKQGSLPEFVSSVLVKPATGKGKGKEELHDVRFPLPWVALSKNLVAGLKTQQADKPCPFTRAEIVDAAAGAPESLLCQAMASEPFSREVRCVRKDGTTEGFAFSSDAQSVVTQDEFLQSMIHSVCTEDAPEVKLSVFKKQLPKDLKAPFADHWLAIANRRESKVFFEVVKATKTDLTLRDTRFPKPEAVLSEKLVAALRDLKVQEPASYPTTFSKLCARVGPEAGILISDRAAALDPYRSEVMTAFPLAAESPIGLIQDVEQLAKCPQLLTVLLPKHVKPEQQVVPLEKIARTKGLHADVQPFVQTSIEQMIAGNSLPSALGALKISKKWNLFFLKDVRRTENPETGPSKSMAASGSFATDFETAFSNLDKNSSIPGCVSLADLRPVLDDRYPRSVFDEELLRLRKANRYSLSAVEGRFPLTEDEKAACLVIDNRSHLLVVRK